MMKHFFWNRAGACLLLCLATLPALAAEPLSFQRAIDLALKRSGTMAIAVAEQVRSHQSYLEARNVFIPSVTFGSGLGYSFGVPQTLGGSPPSIFNVTSSAMALNFAQRDLVRALKNDWQASDLDLLDKKNAVILDTALLYTELDNVTSKLSILREQQAASQKAQFITVERVKEGLDSQLELSRSKLIAARVEMRIAESEGNADVLRERLSRLTGVPTDQLQTVTESVPQPPEISQDRDAIERAVANSPAVKLADQKVRSAEFMARSEQRQMFPSVDFYSQYAMLARYNNYEDFYTKFERHNYTFGASIRFPLFNLAQKARAQAADADLIKARRESDGLRDQVSADTLKLQRSLRQLAAAREVARLEYEISQAGIDQAQVKIESGEATARDLQQARIDASDKYANYLDATLELYKAQMQLLRSTGEIQQWAIK